MKLKATLAVLMISVLASQAQAMFDTFEINEMECYNKIGAVTCNSEGYWEGRNGTTCEASVSYKSVYNTRRNEIGKLSGFGYSTVNTGFFGPATLGIADAIANQGSAIKARSMATKEINAKIRNIKSLVPKCRF